MRIEFEDTDASCIADMTETAAIHNMNRLSALAESTKISDRISASDAYNTASRHTSPEVVTKTVEMSRWLIAHEIFGGNHDFLSIEEDDLDSSHADVSLMHYGKEHRLILPYDQPKPVHPQIQKNVIRELTFTSIRTEESLTAATEEALVMLGILATNSLNAPEARLALGWVGREAVSHEIAHNALNFVNGTIEYDARQIIHLEPYEKIRSSLMALHCIAERNDGFLRDRSRDSIIEARLKFPGQEFYDTFVSASMRQLGSSPFTDFPR